MPLKTIFVAIIACFMLYTARAQNNFKPDKALLKLVNQDIKDAQAQYHVMMNRLGPGQSPRTYNAAKDSLELGGTGWWTSGFYPGTLLYLYRQTKDTAILDEAKHMLIEQAREQYTKTTHDLGFMMYCSFGNALKIAPGPQYKQILVNSAMSLASRFSPKTGCIKSWDTKPADYLVIIDNMMNLELLFWATRATGDSSFYKIAVTHADNTLKNHFRPDGSSFHVLNYNPETGEVMRKFTGQGFADSSAWARGQAWGLYGFTVMYRETKDPKYLEQANRIAGFILNNPNLPANKIPYWDYNAPGIPNALRDVSAGAIMASALLELCRYADRPLGEKYFKAAEAMLKSMSAAPYKAAISTNGGFILQHGVGHKPANSEVDVPLTYADYYFVEALGRYKAFK